MKNTDLKKELDELGVSYPAKAKNEELQALLDEAKTSAAKKASAEVAARPVSSTTPKVPREEFILVDVVTAGTEIKGRAYRKGEQEKLSPGDFEILAAAGAVQRAKANAAEGPQVRFQVTRALKLPGKTYYTGHKFTGPLGLKEAHPNQLKVIGTL